MDEPVLARLLEALRPVAGVAALALGGSRARGTAGPASDYDIGLYYDPETGPPLDLPGLRAALATLVDDRAAAAALTGIGGWGPWINGGGWLTVGGVEVDLLYRDLTRVRAVIAEARAGRIAMHYQPGHPHGFCSAIWMGEVAACRPIHDPAGVIASLKEQTCPYPEALGRALVERFAWEVGFSIENADIAARRDEQSHIAGCAYRALGCIAQVLFALNGRYLINEKGALAEAATFPLTLGGLAGTVAAVWGEIGQGRFAAALRLLRSLDEGLQDLVRARNVPPRA